MQWQGHQDLWGEQGLKYQRNPCGENAWPGGLLNDAWQGHIKSDYILMKIFLETWLGLFHNKSGDLQ